MESYESICFEADKEADNQHFEETKGRRCFFVDTKINYENQGICDVFFRTSRAAAKFRDLFK